MTSNCVSDVDVEIRAAAAAEAFWLPEFGFVELSRAVIVVGDDDLAVVVVVVDDDVDIVEDDFSFLLLLAALSTKRFFSSYSEICFVFMFALIFDLSEILCVCI